MAWLAIDDDGQEVAMSKMNIDQAFEIVCKRLDSYDTFLQMVKMMREAQMHRNDITTTFENFTELAEADKRQELIEKAVDKWLEENI